MRNAKEYYQNSIMHNKPSALLLKFFQNGYNESLDGNVAIDIGCGAGNDTICLLEKGFKVTAVDSDNQVKEIVENRCGNNESLDIVIGDFSKVELPEADLIFANFSLFFVKENFDVFMKNLLEKVNKNGFFVGNFLGKEDDWKTSKTKTVVEKDELLAFFKDFKIYYFSEEKYFKDGITKKNKFWHVYTVIAQKK